MNMTEMYQKMKLDFEKNKTNCYLNVQILMLVDGKRVSEKYENKILTPLRKQQTIRKCFEILKENSVELSYGKNGYIEFSNIEHIYSENIKIDYVVKWWIGQLPMIEKCHGSKLI